MSELKTIKPLGSTEAQPTRSDAARMLNTPVAVDTKKFGPGQLKLREMYLEDVVLVAADLVTVLKEVTSKLSSVPQEQLLMGLIKEPELLDALRRIVAASSDRQPEEFEKMGLTDWMRIVITLKEVVDWEELKNLFFQLVPPEVLQNLRKDLQNGVQRTPVQTA